MHGILITHYSFSLQNKWLNLNELSVTLFVLERNFCRTILISQNLVQSLLPEA